MISTIKKTDEFKTWRATINTQHKEQENTLREQLLLVFFILNFLNGCVVVFSQKHH
jgi:hypothetical protein